MESISFAERFGHYRVEQIVAMNQFVTAYGRNFAF